MFYLQLFNWLILAAASVLSMTLAVVCLLFWIYRTEPIMQASFPELLNQTGIFTGLALVAAVSALTLYYRKSGYWIMQLALAGCVFLTISYYIPD